MSKLTNDDLNQVKGRRDALRGKQQRYHMAREAAEQQIEDWMRTVGEEGRTSVKAGESIQGAYEHWFEHMMDMQQQSIALMSQRARKAMELPARFAECRNPADIAKAQAEFASTMVADYFEAGRRMLNVLTDATQNFAEAQTEAIGQQMRRPKPRRGR
jgi:Phasin protein